MKQECVSCGEKKPVQKFYKTRSKQGGKEYLRHRCKSCDDAAKSKWRLANLPHVLSQQRRRAQSPEYKVVAKRQHKAWRDKNRDHVRKYCKENELKRLYGLTSDDVSVLVLAQRGVCASCGGPPDDKRPLLVDHDHRTGKVRGLLCNSCNLTLGRSKENINRLRALAFYLESHQIIEMPVNDSSTGLIRLA